MTIVHNGSCLCGAVTFEITGELPAPDACHCSKCRKHSGHYFVSTDVRRSAVNIHGADKITWFRSSEKAERGFCSVCGSSLFWSPFHKDWIGVAMGALDSPTGTGIALHIFVAEKGDYYQIGDNVPQHQRTP